MYLRWPAVAAMAEVCLVVFVVPSTQLVLVWFERVALTILVATPLCRLLL